MKPSPRCYREKTLFDGHYQHVKLASMSERLFLRVCATAGLLLVAGHHAPAADVPSFNRDVLPILSDNCFACHGPDAKQAKGGLRLDLRDSATKPAKSGDVAIVPGKPAASSAAGHQP